MLPTVHGVSTGLLLLVLALISATTIVALVADRDLSRVKLVVLTSLAAFAGSRLFHVVFERPGFYLEHPQAIWQRSDGQTCYGAFLGGALALYLMTRRLLPKQRASVWDAAAISVAGGVFFMRLACIAGGCCWGTITDVPWAVVYTNPAGKMPLLGIPVHPVQVYEALLCLSLGIALIALRRRLRGLLIYGWCAGYAVGRFVLERYRADGDRGLGFWPWHLSNSQVISIGLLAWCAVVAWRRQAKTVSACGY